DYERERHARVLAYEVDDRHQWCPTRWVSSNREASEGLASLGSASEVTPALNDAKEHDRVGGVPGRLLADHFLE
ncbi:MAG: hypothetical protein ACRDGK_03580, partial [Actinomycetota bacterium]